MCVSLKCACWQKMRSACSLPCFRKHLSHCVWKKWFETPILYLLYFVKNYFLGGDEGAGRGYDGLWPFPSLASNQFFLALSFSLSLYLFLSLYIYISLCLYVSLSLSIALCFSLSRSRCFSISLPLCALSSWLIPTFHLVQFFLS